MKAASAMVTGSSVLYGDVVETWLLAPEVANGATPGQFVMAASGEGIDPFLRRSHSIYRLRTTTHGREIGLLYEPADNADRWLARRQQGDVVDILGPLGNGFSISPRASNLLLIAEGLGIAPLTWLADVAIAYGRNVTLATLTCGAESAFPLHLLPAELELMNFTEDDSTAAKMPFDNLVGEVLPWADQIFLSAGAEAMSALRSLMARNGLRKPAQVLLNAALPCGLGICNGCTVPMRRGVRLACKDGPVFDLRDIA